MKSAKGYIFVLGGTIFWGISAIQQTNVATAITGCFLAITGKDFSLIHISRIGLITGGASAVCWAFTNVYLRHILLKHYFHTLYTLRDYATSVQQELSSQARSSRSWLSVPPISS